ncbi:hypothetical protein FI667_g9069, partial [Globisporangium splendens]
MSFSFTSTSSSSPPHSVASVDDTSAPFSFIGGTGVYAEPEPEAPPPPSRVTPFSFMSPSPPAVAASPSVNPPTPLKKPGKAKNVAIAADEAEGSVTFSSRAKASYRYRLTVRDDKVTIWIEDKRSKQQWQSSALELCEFVPTDRVIPMATLTDYIENCLGAELNDDDDEAKPAFQRDLMPGDDSNKLKLIFTLRIQMLATVVLMPSYEFVLHPVALSEVDILSAKVRDQEDEIARLRAQVEALTMVKSVMPSSTNGEKTSATVYLRVETKCDVSSNQRLVWNSPEVGYWWQFDASGAITFIREGLFMVQVVIQHTNRYNPDPRVREMQHDAFQLRKNDNMIAACRDSTFSGATQWSQLHHIVPMKKSDYLTVSYSGTGLAFSGSYVIVYQLQ